MSGPVNEPLLELRRLAVSFATDDGTVRAVDGIDLVAGARPHAGAGGRIGLRQERDVARHHGPAAAGEFAR